MSAAEKGPFANKYNSLDEAADFIAAKLKPYLKRDDITFAIYPHNDADGLAVAANLWLLKERCGLGAQLKVYTSDLFANPPLEYMRYVRDKKKNLYMLIADTSIYPPPVPERVAKRKTVRQANPLRTISQLLIGTRDLPPDEQPRLMIIDHHVPPGTAEKGLLELKEKSRGRGGEERVHVIDLKYGIKGLREQYPCVGGFSYLFVNRLAREYGLSDRDLRIRGYNLFAIPSMMACACDDRLDFSDLAYQKIYADNPKIKEQFSYKATYEIWIACNAVANSIISVESNAKRPLAHQQGATKVVELMRFAAQRGDPSVFTLFKGRFPYKPAIADMLERVNRVSWSLNNLLRGLVSPNPLMIPGTEDLAISTCVLHGGIKVDVYPLSEFKVNRKITNFLAQKSKQRMRGKKLPEVLVPLAYGGLVVPDAIIDTPSGSYYLPFMEYSVRRVFGSRYNYKTRTTDYFPVIELTPYKLNIGLGCVNRMYAEFERWETALRRREVGLAQFDALCPLFRAGGSDTAGAVKLPLLHRKGVPVEKAIETAILDEPDLARWAFGLYVVDKGLKPALKRK